MVRVVESKRWNPEWVRKLKAVPHCEKPGDLDAIEETLDPHRSERGPDDGERDEEAEASSRRVCRNLK